MKSIKGIKHQIVLLCLFSVYSLSLFSQEEYTISTIDSLKQVLKTKPADLEKAKIYGDLCWHYNRVSVDSAFKYGDLAVQLSKKLNDSALLAQSYSDLATIYFVNGEMDSSEVLYQKSLAIRTKETDKNEEAIAALGIKLGNVLYKKNKLEKAIKHYMSSLVFFEKRKNDDVTAVLYANIAQIHSTLKNHQKALSYITKSEDYLKKHGQHGALANTVITKGNIYAALGDTSLAIHSYEEALKSAQKVNNFIAEATIYNNLGNLYKDKSQYNRSLGFLKRALKIRLEQNLSSEVASTQLSLAMVYNKMSRYEEAKNELQQSLRYFDETGAGEKIGDIYHQFILAYSGLGKMDSVFHFSDLYVKNFSLEMTNKVIEATNELETKYQTAKKEQEIELLNREKSIQQLKIQQRNLLILFLLAIFLIAIAGIMMWQNRRKIRAEADLQKAATQQILRAEERERRRIAQDLHDGVGQILSTSLLTLNQLLDKIDPNTEANHLADKAIALLTEGYDEMRSISHQMMPNALLKAGLASSIREFVERMDSPKLQVMLDIVGLEGRLDEQTETALYRSIQESVNNVVKHAEASKLTLQLIKDEDGISVNIEDNGKGFDTKNMSSHEGIGLQNISSRIALINGTVEIDSTPGQGTLVAIHIPRV